MNIGKILFYTGLAILALCIATVALFFAVALALGWAYSLFGVPGVLASLFVVWFIAYTMMR